jgi:membrane protease YdiL (CAAX protease family)
MWCPGIAALLTVLIFRTGIRDFGFGLGKILYYPLAIFIPLFYAIIPYAIIWISGLGDINREFSPELGSIFIFAFLIECIQSLGEEIGWRGFLVPKLAKIFKLRGVFLISGIVWAAWHYAAIFIGNYYTGDYPLYAVVCFTVGIIGVGIASAWIRFASQSLLPVVLLHATHNVFIQRILNPATVDTGKTSFLIGEFSVAYLFIGLLVGIIFWRISSRTLPVDSLKKSSSNSI